MKTLAVLASLFCMAAATPALAAFDQLGTIELGRDQTTVAHWSDFGGPVERLSFLTDHDVRCAQITAHYSDGVSKDIFKGTLIKDQRQTILFSDDSRFIRSIDFACHPQSDSDAQVELSADVGQYRAAWRSSPQWTAHWSHVMHWEDTPVTLSNTAMIPLGSSDFGQWTDHSILLSGDSKAGLDAIAFQPVGADASCRRVTANFADGSSRELTINNGEPMRDGTMYRVNIAGGNLNGVALTCHAENSTAVTIKVYGQG